MTRLHRTDSSHPDFENLVKLLDAELAVLDGDDHAFYHQFNKTANLKNTIVLYADDKPVACGAIKPFGDDAMEVKRMYVDPALRGKGLATIVLADLEAWAKELGYRQCVLETGKRQRDAIALYQKNGYAQTPNYGQYVGMANSVCFEKSLL